MNLLELKNKLEKGKELEGEVVYIKEDNIISGIDSVYKNQENTHIIYLNVKVNYLTKIPKRYIIP